MGVTGIGGLFFRARDPDALTAWYRAHLGVGAGGNSQGGDESSAWCWRQDGGDTVFQPFKADTDYWPVERQFMINFRVDGLDALLDRLRAAGIEIVTRPEWDDPAVGRFARIHDPEGNAIELWEPPQG